jgi:hypothetical protein
MKWQWPIKPENTAGPLGRKWLLALFLSYSIAVAFACAFPVGPGNTEWYSFYSYLDKHGAVPYIDTREGYPPLGFLIYEPLYYIFRNDPTAFSYGFKILNGVFLVATLLTLYLTIKEKYGENRALRLSFYYAVLPSVVIANTYSNDIIALLPAALAIYMMLNKKALPCGVMLGLATLGKGFPALLLIPAFITLSGAKERIKLIGSTLLVLVLASLPFALLNPFTYLSTFTHVGSRGPWETVWAIIDGYFSHGGLLHPYFDKFFYHFNLLQMYPASPFDHAIYEWKFDQIPNILTICQIVTIIIISLSYSKRKKDTLQLCGLLYIADMLFFKGYSTQFAVSTPFYVLLAATGTPLLYLIPLEFSHIMQMLSWNSIFEPEFLRNEHLPMLISAIIIRTIVFAALIATAFVGSHPSFKHVTGLAKRFVSFLKQLKDKWLVLSISAMMVMALMSAVPLYSYLNNESSFRSFSGQISVTQSEWQGIKIDGLERGDQVMVRLTTNTWLDAELANSTLQVERGVRNPYNLKSSFNETMLFFIADSQSTNLMLKMKHPRMPFRVTEGLEEDLSVNATTENSALTLRLQDAGIDGNASILTMAYPISVHVDSNFSLHFRYKVLEGNLSNIRLYVFDDTDEWLYPFAAPADFVLTPNSEDLYGHANLINDDISLVAITMSLNDSESATLRIDELSVNGGENYNVKFYAYYSEEVPYEVFIERDFKPSIYYALILVLAVTFGAAALWRLYKKVERSQRVFGQATVS